MTSVKREVSEPDEQPVEVEVRPLLGLPPVMLFAVKLVTLHRACWGSLGDGLKEHSAPGNVHLLLPQVWRQFELQRKLAAVLNKASARIRRSYPGSVLVCLECQVQHLPSLVTLLVYQLTADGHQTRETGLNNAVEVGPILTFRRLVAKSTAEREEALEAGVDGAGAVCVQQLHRELDEAGPSARKVALEDALEDGNKLLAHWTFGGCQNGHQDLSDARLFIFGYQCFAGELIGLIPGTINTILDIDDGWEATVSIMRGAIARRETAGRAYWKVGRSRLARPGGSERGSP